MEYLEPSPTLYNRNLALLSRQDPGFVSQITDSSSPSRDVEVFVARSGAPTIRLGGMLLHSSFDPEREAARVASRSRERWQEELRDATVLCGMGLGYHLEALLQEGEETVIVVEPEVSNFLTALEYRDLTGALADPRTTLVLGRGAAAVIELLNALELRYPVTVAPPPLRALRPSYFEELEKGVESFRKRNEVNANTLSRFGKLWVRNLLINLPLLARSPGLGLLHNAFQGIPALLLAAGPTLDEVLPRLEELRRHLLLIAVDTALPLLERTGVEPDIAVVVDPQYWNTRHLDMVELEKPLLVAEPSTHPRVFRLLRLPVFFGGSLFPLGRYIESSLPERAKLGAGGSVATSAWDVARMVGAGEVYTAGLDLGFPGLRTHARGSFFEERGHTLSGRLAGIEHYSFRYLRGGQPFTAEDTMGRPLLSDRRMQMYSWWFETQHRLHPQVETFTLTAASLAIEGRRHVPTRTLLGLPDRRGEIDRRLEELKAASRRSLAESEERLNAVEKATSALREEIETVISVARSGEKRTAELEEQLRRVGDLTGVELARLDEVDREISSAPNREVLGFLMQEVDQEARRSVTAKERSERLKENLRRSGKIYRQLREAGEYHHSLFAKLLSGAADKNSVE